LTKLQPAIQQLTFWPTLHRRKPTEWAKKQDHLSRFVTRVTQKSDQSVKALSALSGRRVVFSMLSRLNILYTSPTKQYKHKNTIHCMFTTSRLLRLSFYSVASRTI